MRTGKGLQREKHVPVFAGWIPELVWREGCRRSPFTGSHMLIQFTEQGRTAWNRLQIWKFSGQALPRACNSEGGLQGRQRNSTAQGCPRRRLSSFRQPSHKETTGFRGTKNIRAKPDEGELITKAIYAIFAVATHHQRTRSDVLLLREAASLNEGGRT